MTPKEKADELYKKFEQIVDDYHNICMIDIDAIAKESSLICINEICEELNEMGEVLNKMRLEYMEEVKQEINNL